eukprot:8705471-Pyramimonas_sp.AAC.1
MPSQFVRGVSPAPPWSIWSNASRGFHGDLASIHGRSDLDIKAKQRVLVGTIALIRSQQVIMMCLTYGVSSSWRTLLLRLRRQ